MNIKIIPKDEVEQDRCTVKSTIKELVEKVRKKENITLNIIANIEKRKRLVGIKT